MLSIANDFSKFPAGRYPSHGPHNGQRFREEYLLPALGKKEILEIDLDGVEGYGSSFLEEAFGGLVRVNSFKPDYLRGHLVFKSLEDESYIDEIFQYIDEAEARK